MTGRRGEHDADEQRAIGGFVLEARAADVSWKALERRFERDRRTLWRYARAARGKDETKKWQDETPSALRVLLGGPDDRASFPVPLSFAERDS